MKYAKKRVLELQITAYRLKDAATSMRMRKEEDFFIRSDDRRDVDP
jgi:hypothetical protein